MQALAMARTLVAASSDSASCSAFRIFRSISGGMLSSKLCMAGPTSVSLISLDPCSDWFLSGTRILLILQLLQGRAQI